MEPSQDFKSMQDRIQSSLLSTTRIVNQIAGEDLVFQRTANPSTGDRLDEQSDRLVALANDLLTSSATANGSNTVDLEDTDDVEAEWHGIVDTIDGLLEKTDTCLDEYTGRVKRKNENFPEPANTPPAKRARTTDQPDQPNWRRANIIKPQNAFEQKFDNFATGPWKPSLTRKPHATVPLEESLILNLETQEYKHPYETEILNLKYPPRTYEICEPIPYRPIEKAPAIWVDTYEGVLEMLGELQQAEEIAVDLEHHDLRTYQGLLSLMQISTREKDWVVDTLRPWRHKLEILNEVFADPKILKVFHGAFMDIIWLQRDLGLYIVGLFDTFHACVALNYPTKSLAYLLKKHVGFDADKKYQMADWRIRPLTEEMLYYARCDTHYLLYVYDLMRNELVKGSDPTNPDPQKNLIEHALQRSKETSLDRYTPPEPNSSTGDGNRGWGNALKRYNTRLDGSQFAVFRAVHKWRDDLARKEDENPNFIIPAQTLMDIAKLLPGDPKALWSLLGRNCAAVVQRSLDELFKLVLAAKEEGANGPSNVEYLRGIGEGNSAAAVAKRELGKSPKKAKPDLPPVDQLRSQKSQLFGSMPISSAWERSKKVLGDASKTLMSLPWVNFVRDAAASAAEQEAVEAKAQQQKDADMIPLETKPARVSPTVTADTEFTLRQGRKRKHEDVQAKESDQESEGGAAIESQDMIPLDAQETRQERRAKKKMIAKERKLAEKEVSLAREQHKAERKQANKKARLGADGSGEGGAAEEDGEDDDEAPFDYTQAQSVLHAQRALLSNTRQDNAGRRNKPAFDPYAARINSEDGPKPARRMHSERAGKTATFKK